MRRGNVAEQQRISSLTTWVCGKITGMQYGLTLKDSEIRAHGAEWLDSSCPP
jgi:hypothetical protein